MTDDASTGGPALVGANWYRFRANENIRHERVESVSFIWADQGTGVITSGGHSFTLTTNSLLRLPWRHDVEYIPDRHSPFRLGTIHLVPWHDYAVPIEPRVGFQQGDPLVGVSWRRSLAQPEAATMVSSRAESSQSVIALASYGVERFLAGRTDEAVLRSLGVLIADESAGWTRAQPDPRAIPPVVELMIEHILDNLDRPLTVAEIAAAGGCSVTTAERQFTRYAGVSVVTWMRRRRMQEAALLLRTSGFRVNEVARRVGYPDPLYFSRVFSAVYGVPPSRYWNDQLRP